MRGPEEWPSRGSNPADRIRLTDPAAKFTCEDAAGFTLSPVFSAFPQGRGNPSLCPSPHQPLAGTLKLPTRGKAPLLMGRQAPAPFATIESAGVSKTFQCQADSMVRPPDKICEVW